MEILRQVLKSGKTCGNFDADVIIGIVRTACGMNKFMRWSSKVSKIKGIHVNLHLRMNRFFANMDPGHGDGHLFKEGVDVFDVSSATKRVKFLRTFRSLRYVPEYKYSRKFITYPVRYPGQTEACFDPGGFDLDIIDHCSKSTSVRGIARRRPVRYVSRNVRRNGLLISISTNCIELCCKYQVVRRRNETQQKEATGDGGISGYIFAANDKGRGNLAQFGIWTGDALPQNASKEDLAKSKALSRVRGRKRFLDVSGQTKLEVDVQAVVDTTRVPGCDMLLGEYYTSMSIDSAPYAYDNETMLDRSTRRGQDASLLTEVVASGVYEKLRWDRYWELKRFYSNEYGYLARLAIKQNRKLIIFDGHAGFAASGKGENAVPTNARVQTMESVLRSYSELKWARIDVSEHLTSKLHHRCLQRTQSWEVKGKKIRDFRWCTGCKSRFSRDRNAVRNILFIGLSMWGGFEIPPAFKMATGTVAWIEMANAR